MLKTVGMGLASCFLYTEIKPLAREVGLMVVTGGKLEPSESVGTDLTEGTNGSTNNAMSFGVTDRSLDLDQTREELGDERMDGDDDGDTALSSSELLVETAREGGYSLQVSMSVVMNGKLLHTRLTLGTVRTLSRKSTDSVNSDPHRLVKSSLPCQVKR